MSIVPDLPNVPKLAWLNGVVGDVQVVSGDSSIQLTAGSKTDWFNPPPTDPSSPQALANAPALVFDAPSLNNSTGWQLSAKVTVQHQYLFDAATLFVHQGPDDWCKLCFEYSPEKLPCIVSVVTRVISDDASGPPMAHHGNNNNTVHLRISKYASVLAFHYSMDGGVYWTLHRVFSLRNPKDHMKVGFLAQCPTGDSCTALFEEIKFTETTLANLRDGS
jgi:uncharacterized protein